MNNRFTVELSSNLDYQEMVVNITFDEVHIGTLTCEEGEFHVELEVLSINEQNLISMPYDDYMKALEFAKQTLIQSEKKT